MQINDQLITVNFSRGRLQPISMIVIHVMEGDLPHSSSSPYEWFNDPTSGVSAHYGIPRLPGPIRRWVREGDTAWHAGRIHQPSAAQVMENLKMNPNSYSIGIENEGSGKEDPTDFQMRANAWLVWDICRRRKLNINRRTVVGHREIFSQKSCPGLISIASIVRQASIVSAGDALVPEPSSRIGQRVWSSYFQDFLIITNYISDLDWSFIRQSEASLCQSYCCTL